MADRSLRIRMLLEAADRVTKPLRDIAGGSSKAAQALKATRDRLKEIDRAQADIAGFRQLKAGLASTGEAMQAARARASQLGREMAEADAPTRKLARDFDKARREAERLTRQHQSESRQLQDLREQLRAAGVETNDLARHERRLRTESSRTNGELAEQERRLRTLADRSRRLGAARASFGRVQGAAVGLAASGASGLATGMALSRPFLGGVRMAQAYQSAMTDIAQKADLSRRDAEAMGKGLLLASRAANQLPDQLQAGVDILSGFGLDPRKAVAMMQPIGRAATAYKAEIADLSAAAFAANDNLKVPVEQTARVIDIMAQAGKDGAFEVKDMAGAFPALTAGYQALGQTGVGAVADLSAALQIARKGAGDSATAATNVSNIIQKIAAPLTIKKFKKFGIDLPTALKKAYADGKTPLEAIAELTNKATGGDLGKIGFLFEDAQVQQGLRPLIQNLDEYRRIRESASNAKGVTDRDFAERMRDSAEESKKLEVNAKALGISLGTILLPTVNVVTAKAAQWAAGIGRVAQRHPTLTKAVVISAAALSSLFIVLGAGAIAIAAVLGPFALLSAIATYTGIAMLPLIGIVGGVVLAIVAIAAAAYLIYAKWGAITEWFAGAWSDIKLMFNDAMGWFGSLPARFAEFGRAMIVGLIGGILGMLGKLKSTIVNAASNAADWFKSKLGIHSPSRVFTGFGGFMMQGLSNGIAAGESEPIRRVDRLSKRITAALAAGAATTAMTAPAMAAGGHGAGKPGLAAAQHATAPITINVYGAPGQDVKALADEVMRQLEAKGRAKGNATFADEPDWS